MGYFDHLFIKLIMKYKSILCKIFYLCIFLFSQKAKAQDPNFPIISMGIQSTPVAHDTSGGLPDLSDSTRFSVQMNISLFDTTMIDEMYVVLKDSAATTNLLSHTFDWDVSGSTGNGTSYTRTEYNLILGLGNFTDLLNYTASVRIKRLDGTYTDYIYFSR